MTALGQNNPDLYRQMSEPFASPEDAEKALEAFHEALYELRIKHKIPDCLVLSCVSIRYGEGDVGHVMSRLYCGDDFKAEAIAAWGMGYESSERQERIAMVVGQAAKGSVKRRKNKP